MPSIIGRVGRVGECVNAFGALQGDLQLVFQCCYFVAWYRDPSDRRRRAYAACSCPDKSLDFASRRSKFNPEQIASVLWCVVEFGDERSVVA